MDGALGNTWQDFPPPHTPSLLAIETNRGQDPNLSPIAEPLAPSQPYSHRKSALGSATLQHRGSQGSDLIRSDFWFDDGNIVIITGSAAFKVHRGQLERHSEVFTGLFGLPQPPGAEEDSVDGCPYVELHDTPSDMFYFLGALYDGLYFKVPRVNDFPAVAAVLRLSTKYMVESLRIRCLYRLHLDWPLSLQLWDQRESLATDRSGVYFPRRARPHPILVIQLALEMGVPSILPAAFYDLARYSPCHIVAGTTNPTLAYDAFVADSPSESPDPPPELNVGEVLNLTSECISYPNSVQLSHALLCKTLRGREASQRYIATFCANELDQRQPASKCLYGHRPDMQRKRCVAAFNYIAFNLLRSVGGVACGRDADPLFSFAQILQMLSSADYMVVDQYSDGVNWSNNEGVPEEGDEEHQEPKRYALGMCSMCKIDLAGATGRAREEVWDLLPAWFELR